MIFLNYSRNSSVTEIKCSSYIMESYLRTLQRHEIIGYRLVVSINSRKIRLCFFKVFQIVITEVIEVIGL